MAGAGIPDRFKAALAAIVRSVVGTSVVGARVDYLAAYPCRVVAQNADGTLELVPDDARLPPYSKVPVAIPFPGVSFTVAPGARCKIQFGAGDPQKFFVALWESGTLLTLTLHGATLNVGQSGDTVVLSGGTFPVARGTGSGDTAGEFPIIGGNPKVLG